jgi:hypothetical protein
MKKLMFLLILIPFSALAACQTPSPPEFNFGFEKILSKNSLPDHWFKWGMEDYVLKTDTIEKHSGSVSILIEPVGSRSEGEFGCAAYFIPAIYKGSQIELRAYLKLQDVEDGQIGLMLRIDGTDGGLQFDNLQQDNIHGTSDWKQYSVTLPLPENATKIYIGALLVGSGKLWADDFQVFIDGKDISKAPLKN